jgi:hypothetical protein
VIAAHGGDVQETLFYIVYAIRERLTRDQLKQCVARDAYTSLLGGDKKNYSKKLKELYPTAPVVIKDRAFLDYLALPERHRREVTDDHRYKNNNLAAHPYAEWLVVSR